MDIVDTHAHLDLEDYEDDLVDVLQRAGEAGVNRIICVGTSLEASERCVELARRFPQRIYATVGIHPNYCSEANTTDWDRIGELARLAPVVAIGETGLDFHHSHSDRDSQEAWFRRHIELSLSVGKPLIVHARKADQRSIELLAEGGEIIHGVRHCFDSSAQIAAQYVERGLHVGFGGLLTREGHKKLKQAARTLPEERLLVETDCPYMTPRSVESRRNEPAHIVKTVEALADIRSSVPQHIADLTTRNAGRLFFP